MAQILIAKTMKVFLMKIIIIYLIEKLKKNKLIINYKIKFLNFRIKCHACCCTG